MRIAMERYFAVIVLIILQQNLIISQKKEKQDISENIIAADPADFILKKADFKHYIDALNASDSNYHFNVIPHTSMISNEDTWNFLKDNIPFFECPDKEIMEVYYYRWWTFRKHIKKTPDGYVITEFMPEVDWAGKYNTISCAAALHFREGRWLHNPEFLTDYGEFWLRKGGDPYRYSFWISDSYMQLHYVHPADSVLLDVLPDLISNYAEWELRRKQPDGLFFQIGSADGMEVGIGGAGKRPTINSYMFAEAKALSAIGAIKKDTVIENYFREEAEKLRQLTLDKLWDKQDSFFKVIRTDNKALKAEYRFEERATVREKLADVRELIGYVPWYHELPPQNMGYEVAWKQLMDNDGFYAPFGPTTAEQRHPEFRISYEGHECKWNGPSWPFATSQTLTALANVLNNYQQNVIDKNDYFDILKIYTKSHRFRQIPPDDSGDTIISNDLWIDENLNPYTGDWLARTRMEVQKYKTNIKERGAYYNHSTYNDLIITGLVGIRPTPENEIIVNPMIPDHWEWFCLDNVSYKGKLVTILWDKTGAKYQRGIGLKIYVNGIEKVSSREIKKLSVCLSEN